MGVTTKYGEVLKKTRPPWKFLSFLIRRFQRILYSEMVKNARSKPINFSDDVVARASPFIYHTVKKYGNANMH